MKAGQICREDFDGTYYIYMEKFPEMAQQFRLVNYNNLLIYIIYIPVGGLEHELSFSIYWDE